MTLDVGQLLAGQAGLLSYAAVAIIIAMAALAGFFATKLGPKLRRLQLERWERQQLADEETLVVIEQRIIRRLRRESSALSWKPIFRGTPGEVRRKSHHGWRES